MRRLPAARCLAFRTGQVGCSSQSDDEQEHLRTQYTSHQSTADYVASPNLQVPLALLFIAYYNVCQVLLVFQRKYFPCMVAPESLESLCDYWYSTDAQLSLGAWLFVLDFFLPNTA